ncbi:hypothetical protein DL96DRAFT_1627085 [Flagelloscypha sp. PMI_526]|nr:hypothetical protein DL96DRAFT_1627085 [Flagelloscypha sp. PMI_526]
MWFPLLLFCILLCTGFVEATRNISVDDTSPRITYSPASTWRPGSSCDIPTVGCPTGLAFDNNAASNKTWYFALSNSTSSGPFSAEFTFTGTAIFVFGIDTSSINLPQTLTFFVDGTQSGGITTSGKDSPFFSLTGLTNGEHTIRVETVADAAGNHFVTLDRFIYTEDDTLPTRTSSTLPTQISTTVTDEPTTKSGKRISGPVIGGVVVAVIVALALAGLLLFLISRRRSRRSGALRNAVLSDDERPFPRGPTLVEPFSISTATSISTTQTRVVNSVTEKTRADLTSGVPPLERRSSTTKGPTNSPSQDEPPSILSPLLQTTQNTSTNVQPQQQDLDNVPLEALMINLAARGVPVPGDAVPPAYASM